MRSKAAAVFAVLLIPLLALGSCGSEAPETVVETVTTTVPPSSSSATSSTSPTSSSEAPAAAQASDGCGAVGFTDAPGQQAPHCLGKTISHCGDSTMEYGTTFFTDGTSGWTQYCQNQMAAAYPPAPAPTFDQEAYNEQFAEEYWRTHPTPTFDPDSADGYGPDQEIPPACLRFENVDC